MKFKVQRFGIKLAKKVTIILEKIPRLRYNINRVITENSYYYKKTRDNKKNYK